MSRTDTAPAAMALRDAAHELNNLCATIIGFATLAEESEQENSTAAGYLTEIRLATEAVAAVARQLRTLSEDLGTLTQERRLVDQTGIEPVTS